MKVMLRLLLIGPTVAVTVVVPLTMDETVAVTKPLAAGVALTVVPDSEVVKVTTVPS